MARPDIFRAIADPTRREISRLLSEGAMTVGDVAERFDMTRPAVAKHLKVLSEWRTDQRRGARPRAVQPAQRRPPEAGCRLGLPLRRLLGRQAEQTETRSGERAWLSHASRNRCSSRRRASASGDFLTGPEIWRAGSTPVGPSAGDARPLHGSQEPRGPRAVHVGRGGSRPRRRPGWSIPSTHQWLGDMSRGLNGR